MPHWPHEQGTRSLGDYPVTGARPGDPLTIASPSYGPEVAAMDSPEMLARRLMWMGDRERQGKRYADLLSGRRPPHADLFDAVAEELAWHRKTFRWSTYGGRRQTVTANAQLDITRTIDPQAYFVATQLQFYCHTSAAQDVSLQLVEANGVELFRAPLGFRCFNVNSAGSGVLSGIWPFPRDWILGPGEVAIIRLRNRTAGSVVLDVHLGGYKVYARPSSAIRAAMAEGGRAGLSDYILRDAAGRVQRIGEATPYPGAALVAPSVFPDLQLDQPPLPGSVGPLIRGLRDTDQIAAVLEAYRSTYRPFAYGQGSITTAASDGAQGTAVIPLSGDSYFVGTQILVGQYNTSDDAELQILESASGQQLFGDAINFEAFNLTGGPTFGYAPLPQRYVLSPRDELTYTITNRDGAVDGTWDVALAGYKVYVK